MARRNPPDGAALDPALTQKKRARRRLVGAIVLGIAAAIVLPLLLDSEPRQTITDVEIEIPSREIALPSVDVPKPDAAAVAPRDAGSVGEPVVPPAVSEPVEAVAGADNGRRADARIDAGATTDPEPGKDAKSAGGIAANASTGTAEGAEGSGGMRSASKTPTKPANTQRSASAAPSGRPDAVAAASSAAKSAPAAPSPPKSAAAAPASGTRFALQVGAYANAGSARAQLDKAKRTGLRAYTETVATAQGERTRVRVGPFPTREAAEKARATLKLAGMESAVVDAR